MPHPETLGPYRITKTIGRGGMGTVYAAIDETTGTPVAVKLIAQQLADEPRFRDRFTTEIKSLHRLQHKGIVRFMHSHIDEEGQIFYSMELVEGESLQARIRREKKLDWSSVIDIAIQISSALKHAHDAGVIHRDLKPANLMLTNDGSIKLVDFGIAKLFGDNQLTHEGSVLGTADYMAPEQADTTRITARTDLYALGNVMYAMLIGRPPFTGKKMTEVIHALKVERPAPLDLIDPTLPDELVELVHHLLEKDPDKRPPTAMVVMKRLRSMQAGLERRRPKASDSTPTMSPRGDDSSDTSTDGLSKDPGVATDVSEARSGGQGTVRAKKQAPSLANPSAATHVSVGDSKTMLPDGSVAADEEPVRQKAVTDFHLEDEPAHGTTGLHPSDKHASSLTHWLTIGCMVGILIIGGGLLIYAMRPPTADQLYESAIAGETGSMKTFLRRFPQDDRFAEVEKLHMSARLEAVLKRLSTQSKIGVTPLSAAQEGFVAAMHQRAGQPQESVERLQQWLNVYEDPGEDADSELSELVELARYERDQLETRTPAIIIDPRARELIDDITRIVQQETDEVARKRLQGMIQTFADADWAQPAVEEATRQLEKINESSSQP